MTNYIRYRLDYGAFYFSYLHPDNLMDMNKQERKEYEHQLYLWECDDESDEGFIPEELAELYRQAKQAAI